jgi:hypothetical protein
MNERMVLCPVCRVAVPDRDYWTHSQQHQRGCGHMNFIITTAAVGLAIGWWLGVMYLTALVLA